MGAMTIKRSPLCFGFHFQLLPDNINFNGHSTAAFLSCLRKTLSGPITLIWDEVRIHRASPVKEFIFKNPSVEVQELPPYTPGLNPVDNVWSYVKFSRLSNYCPRNLSELRMTIMAELSKVNNNCGLLISLFSGTKLSLNGIG
jgi:transposase